MDERIRRQRSVGKILDAAKHTPDFGYYRIPDTVLLGLAALYDTWGADFESEPTRDQTVGLLKELRPFVPSLFQKRPPPEPTPIDLSKWKNPVTGESPPNPFARETLDLSEQNWLIEHEPVLADYLKRQAGGGNSFSAIGKQRETEARNKALREMSYDEKSQENNVYRFGNLSAKNDFRKLHGDDVADFFEREATEHARLPWLGEGNMTELNVIINKAPKLHELIQKSIKTAQTWAKDDITRFEKEIGENQARAKAAREVLEQKLAADRKDRDARIEQVMRGGIV